MLHTIYKKIRRTAQALGWKKILGGIAVLVLGFWIASALFGSTPTSTGETPTTRTVTIASVRDLSLNITPLSVVGTVTSKSEATVRAESSGQATGVYRELGDSVTAGTVIAELDNAAQRASVLQAQAGVDAALAANNVQESTLKTAEDGAVTALLSAYAAVENNVHGTTDDMFSNPEGARPQLIVQTANTQAKLDAEGLRLSISPIIARQRTQAASISAGVSLNTEIAKTESELRMVRDFYDVLIRALNTGVATEGVGATALATYKSDATTARTAITTALTTLVTARQTLEVAQKNSSDTGSTNATLAQAQAALAAARAQLEKTIIRAPISGTINSLSLKRGDYVQATTPVVTIANNGALEVVAYITENDARELKVGGDVEMNNGTKGTITRIAPALDPLTKKIEVRIGITNGTDTLINGQSVTAYFVRTGISAAQNPIRIVVPISALKIGSENTIVFTVDTNNTLVAHPVTLGTLLGDRAVITSGITFDDIIVVDARGLQNGEVVIPQ